LQLSKNALKVVNRYGFRGVRQNFCIPRLARIWQAPGNSTRETVLIFFR